MNPERKLLNLILDGRQDSFQRFLVNVDVIINK